MHIMIGGLLRAKGITLLPRHVNWQWQNEGSTFPRGALQLFLLTFQMKEYYFAFAILGAKAYA